MRINKRLMIVNITVTILSMLLLSLVITGVLKQYYEEDVRNKLMEENSKILSWLPYKNVIDVQDDEMSISKEFLSVMNKQNLDYKYVIVIKKDKKNMLFGLDQEISPEVFMNYQDSKDIYNLKIDTTDFLAFNDSTTLSKFTDVELSVITYIENNVIDELIFQISFVLIGAVIVISIFSFLMTHYYDKKLIEPVHKLVEATKDIADKKFSQEIDISSNDEFKILADAISEMSSKLQKKDIEQREFYENISHEVKTPLTIISSYAQGIQSGIIDNSEDALDTIVTECSRLKKLLEDYIYLSKLESKEFPYHFEKSDLNDLIGSVLNTFQNVFVLGGVEVKFAPNEKIIVELDQHSFEKALSNIILNCMRYTKDILKIEVSEESGTILIRISDNGPGFNPTLLEQKISREGLKKSDGNGLGISIVNNIMKAHQGELTLSNHNGAVYCLKLIKPIE